MGALVVQAARTDLPGADPSLHFAAIGRDQTRRPSDCGTVESVVEEGDRINLAERGVGDEQAPHS